MRGIIPVYITKKKLLNPTDEILEENLVENKRMFLDV
jgi:hypothetical protein